MNAQSQYQANEQRTLKQFQEEILTLRAELEKLKLKDQKYKQQDEQIALLTSSIQNLAREKQQLESQVIELVNQNEQFQRAYQEFESKNQNIDLINEKLKTITEAYNDISQKQSNARMHEKFFTKQRSNNKNEEKLNEVELKWDPQIQNIQISHSFDKNTNSLTLKGTGEYIDEQNQENLIHFEKEGRKDEISYYDRQKIDNYIYNIKMSKIIKSSTLFLGRRQSLSERQRAKKEQYQREVGWNDRIIANDHILNEMSLSQTISSHHKTTIRSAQLSPLLPDVQSQVVQKYLKLHEEQKQQQTQLQFNKKVIQIKVDQVRQLWKVYKVPQVHQKIFFNILHRVENKVEALEKEISLLDKKLSPIQQCTFAIIAREKCLKLLFETLDKYQTNQEQQYSIEELVDHLRLLTLNVVEGIQKWKFLIQQNDENLQVSFKMDDGTIYIDKIVNDYTYLYVSELSKIYELSESPDPFFLRILNKESEQQKYQNKLQNSRLKALISRIRRAEVMIVQEQFLNKRQTTSDVY
ncbi:hypothetical protein pb186bvf_004267 [Paramecium bursaria]